MSFRLLWLLGAILVSSSMGQTGPAKAHAASAHRPNIILITLDTTRADRMGFLGSKLGLTPNLNTMAQDSVVFSRAYAQVPLTTPSHAALLTGTYPQFSHVEDLGSPLGKDLPYVPDLLHRQGYHTAAFIGSYILAPKSMAAPGFDRGFDTYDADFHPRGPGEDRYKTVERRAGDVVDRALAWMAKHRQGPFFIWLHFYDAHDPYDPPEPYKTKYASSLYDGEIAYTDSAVGKLLGSLRSQDLYRGALIAVAADHGEAFGEHSEKRHGMFLYDETVHVPLLFKLPSGRYAGRKVYTRVALADLAPSVLEIAGIPVPKTMQAESLLGQMKAAGIGQAEGAKSTERPIYSETNYAHRAFGWSVLRSWRAGKYLYVEAPKRELYDQSSDPEALKNLAATAQAVADTLDSQLESFHAKTAVAKTGHPEIDPAAAENLHALGYLASETGSGNDDPTKAAIDPKDKIEVANTLHDALIDIEEDRYDDAIPRLEKVIQEEPETSTAYLELGRALVHVKQYQRALPPLRTAVERMPNSEAAHYQLGLALVKTGQWEGALPEFQAAEATTPGSAQLHFYLAAIYTRLKRIPDAFREFEATLKLDPKHYEANLLYGRVLFLEGKPQQALPKLQEAAKIQPDAMQAHAFLADAYMELGQQAKADRERSLAQRSRQGEQP